jgi:hypothetical protein
MRALALIGAAALALAVVPHAADAQYADRGIVELHKHRGFWLSFGGGGGWEDTDFTFGTEGRGAAAYVRMGGTVRPQVLFGGEALVWFNENGAGPDLTRVNVTASTLLYPSIRGGWFLKGGFGVAVYEVGGFDRQGIGPTIGTGFDLQLGRNFYVTPNVDYMVQFFDDDTVGSLLFTVGVTWH